MPGGRRNERVDDLFFEDQTAAGTPAEEGQVRLVSGDLVGFVGGSAKSLTAAASAELDKIVTRRSDACVVVQRSTGNVVTAR